MRNATALLAAALLLIGASALNAAGPTVSVTGCVQREADYLNGGRPNPSVPSVVGTSGDHELVLVHATSPTEIRGSLLETSGNSYMLTGPIEIRLEQYLGQRVELTGILQTDPIGSNGPGGPHAIVQPASQQLVASLFDLRVLEVTAVKLAIGACPVG